MMKLPIQLTDAAQAHLLDMLTMTGQKAILLKINSKGCGGHTYQMNFVDPDFGGECIQLDSERRLIIDQKSMLWMIGTEIDYQNTGLDAQLVFINPMETGRCACNQSFKL